METETGLDFNTLISYHKQEASEELTYIVIMFTIILGLLSYLGSANKIERSVRIIISLIFASVHSTLLMSLLGSLKFHNALHLEIKNYALLHPNDFIFGTKSDLFNVLINLEPNNGVKFLTGGIVLGIAVILGFMTVGEGKVFSLNKKDS